MKVGSLVVCVDDSKPFGYDALIFPKKNIIYTVRSFDYLPNDPIPGLYLEEVVNEIKNYADGYKEPSFHPKRFRELDTPVSISIEEILHETVPA
jgi:hypothetical protein